MKAPDLRLEFRFHLMQANTRFKRIYLRLSRRMISESEIKIYKGRSLRRASFIISNLTERTYKQPFLGNLLSTRY